MQPPQTVSQGQEGVATALVACKILREMSHLEAEAEADRSARVASYEQLALGEALPGLWAPPGAWPSPPRAEMGPRPPHSPHLAPQALWWEGPQGD